MAQKYEIYHESGWDETSQSPAYTKLTTVKNEQAAFNFVNDLDNIGRYGNMVIKLKANGSMLTFNDSNGKWE